MRARHSAAVAIAAVLVGVGAFVTLRAPRTAGAPAEPKDETPLAFETEDEPGQSFKMPHGKPAAVSCGAAQAIVRQARATLAYAPPPVDARELAKGTTDWLDPHGLWSAADDAPSARAIAARAKDLAAEVESAKPCRAAGEVARALRPWIAELRAEFDAHRTPREGGLEAIRAPLATEPVAARALAAAIGDAAGAASKVPGGARYADAARDHFFPELSEAEWADVVLAAVVRAYVPLLDPHGAWAPEEEESTVYELDLDARPAPRLWERATRTALGLKIEAGAEPPLAPGDVVLDVAGLALAGLAPEQADQLSFAAAEGAQAAVVLRAGKTALETLDLSPRAPSRPTDPPAHALPEQRVAFGAAYALVLTPHDVEDDLGALVGRALGHERGKALGVVLDLRGNGGGSTEGAIDALAAFLPKATLFPMKRRDGTTETDRAPEAPDDERWSGPVATLVDGSTASAAEMIAGALAAYRRGPAVGQRTYGKGCAQEYVDDDANAGVLRLTTLLYALPDGTPVQRVGLTPSIEVAFGAAAQDDEREAALPHAPPAWHGPDVRDRGWERWETPWPAHDDRVGPCADPGVCRALRALGGWSPRKAVGRRR